MKFPKKIDKQGVYFFLKGKLVKGIGVKVNKVMEIEFVCKGDKHFCLECGSNGASSGSFLIGENSSIWDDECEEIQTLEL